HSLLSFLILNDTPPTQIYTLSLHDALPISDVLYIKVREDRRVVSKSCHVAIGISESGNREIIGLMIQDGESESTWANFHHLGSRSEEHTSELQSRFDLVCRLLLEKKNTETK